MDVVVGRRLRQRQSEHTAAVVSSAAAVESAAPPAELTLMDDPPPQRARWVSPVSDAALAVVGDLSHAIPLGGGVMYQGHDARPMAVLAGCPHCGATVRQAHTVGCYGVGGVVLP